MKSLWDWVRPNHCVDIFKVLPVKTERGVWVLGTVDEYHFAAFVLARPAQNRQWEIGGKSRIELLELRPLGNEDSVAFGWGRGPGISSSDPSVLRSVHHLASVLADRVDKRVKWYVREERLQTREREHEGPEH